ncbi:MAG: hypothetical protein RIS05_178 [Actinomycetota bacterium]|jgi:hypothetical protein
MTSTPGEADSPQNHGEDEKDLIDKKFNALISGLSLDQSAPSSYLDELDRIEQSERFTPPAPPKVTLKESLANSFKAFKRWKDNPRSNNSDLDDDGAQI